MHVDAFNPTTALAGIEHRAVDKCFYGCIQIRIVHDITGVFAAQLKADTGKRACSGAFHCFASANRARKVDEVKSTVGDQVGRCVVIQKNVLKHVCRYTRRVEGLCHSFPDKQGLCSVL